MEVTAVGGKDPLPDLYKLPPEDITTYDDWRHDRVSGEEDPEPDYSSDDSDSGGESGDRDLRDSIKPRLDVILSSDSYEDALGNAHDEIPDTDYKHDPKTTTNSGAHLIEPRKLQNPCRESREHKDLHREMMMNKKMGVDVLHQKSELTKELDRRRATAKKNQSDEVDRKSRTSFEIKLEEQANKLKLLEKIEQPIKEEAEKAEFLKVFSKISHCKSGDS